PAPSRARAKARGHRHAAPRRPFGVAADQRAEDVLVSDVLPDPVAARGGGSLGRLVPALEGAARLVAAERLPRLQARALEVGVGPRRRVRHDGELVPRLLSVPAPGRGARARAHAGARPAHGERRLHSVRPDAGERPALRRRAARRARQRLALGDAGGARPDRRTARRLLRRPGSHAVTPDVGDLAPDFALADSGGATRSLASLVSARSLVLIFFRGHW